MSIVVTPKHAPNCQQTTRTFWQRIIGAPTHRPTVLLVERYNLLCGGEAIYVTCAHCAHVSAFRISSQGQPIPLEGIDVYGTPTELATVIT